jgi:hypothetical protein
MPSFLKSTLLAMVVMSIGAAHADDAKTVATGNIGDFFKREKQPAPAAATAAPVQAQAERKRRTAAPAGAARSLDNARR